jgi:hypothetical protein
MSQPPAAQSRGEIMGWPAVEPDAGVPLTTGTVAGFARAGRRF